MLESVRGRLGRWTTVAKLLITLLLLFLLFTRVDPRSVLGAWTEIRLGWALVALALVVPNLLCQYGRVRVGLVRAHPGAGRIDTLCALLFGLAMGAVTPGRLGELGGVMILPRGGRRRALGVLAVIRMYGFVTTIALGSIMWALMPELLGLPLPVARTVAPTVLAFVVLAVVGGELLFRQSRRPWAERLAKRLRSGEDVFVGARTLRTIDRVWVGIWSFLLSLVFLSQLVYLMRAFGADVTWAQGIAAGAITTGIVALLPIAAGNVGVRESATILVWQHLGVAPPVAFNAAFMLFLINVVLPGIGGLAWNAVSKRTSDKRMPA